MHHAARHGPGVADLHRVAEAGEVIGGGQAGRPGADHQHPLARALRRPLELPAMLDGGLAQKTLHGVDADRAVEVRAVAAVLARVVADPAVHRRHRVVRDQDPPRLLEAPALRRGEPGLDVLARRAGVVARRQEVDIDRPLGPERPGPALVRKIRRPGELEVLATHATIFQVRLGQGAREGGPSTSIKICVEAAAAQARTMPQMRPHLVPVCTWYIVSGP
jgi:hypothetical protein